LDTLDIWHILNEIAVFRLITPPSAPLPGNEKTFAPPQGHNVAVTAMLRTKAAFAVPPEFAFITRSHGGEKKGAGAVRLGPRTWAWPPAIFLMPPPF
jgi:hypothetical protein